MFRTHVFITLICALSLHVNAQDSEPNPQLSKVPLTADQVAIYRMALEGYVKGSDGALNIANLTEPLDVRELKSGEGCLKGIRLEKSDNGRRVHQLNSAVITGPKMALVDPRKQNKQVEENDPSRMIKKSADKGEPVSESRLAESVNLAFSSGLFRLSEIVFDQQHRYAVLSYSFVCGSLCGHGRTIVVKKVGRQWKVTQRSCGTWIS